MKVKVKLLEVKDSDKSKEISELNDRLEMLYATVEQIVSEREDLFMEALKAGKITPAVKGTKKRRKAKQHPTPSPTHQHPGPNKTSNQRTDNHLEHNVGYDGHAVTANLTGDDKVLTAEEIAKLYEDVDGNSDEN